MKKYLVLYRSDAALSGVSASEMFAKSTPEQMQAGMAVWRAWHEKCGKAIVDLGAPLDRPTTVAAADGPGTAGKSSISGYSMLQAGSMEEAVRLIQGHPHFHTPGGASVEILECVAMPGM